MMICISMQKYTVERIKSAVKETRCSKVIGE